MISLLEDLFVKTLLLSAMGSVLFLLIAAVRLFLRGRLSPGWLCLLWLPLVLRLAVPWIPQSPISLFNLVPLERQLVMESAPPAAPSGPASSPAPLSLDQTTIAEPVPPQTDSSGKGFAPGTNPYRTSITLDGKKGVSAPTVRELLADTFSPLRTLALVWLTVAAGLIAAAIRSSLRFAASVRHTPDVESPPVQSVLEACRREMGVHTRLRLAETGRVRVPTLYGLLRPRLLLPEGALASLAESELRHIVLHELAHLKRRDIPVNGLASLLLALHWFNPLFHYAARLWQGDQEAACDALALSRLAPGERKAYGFTLLKLAETLALPCLRAGTVRLAGGRRELRRRMILIAAPRQTTVAGIAIGLAAIAILTGCTLTGASPGSAGQAPSAAGAASSPAAAGPASPAGPASSAAAPTDGGSLSPASDGTVTVRSGDIVLTAKPTGAQDMSHHVTIRVAEGQSKKFVWNYGGGITGDAGIEEADINGDGVKEIVIDVPIGSGTGVAYHEVHVLSRLTLSELPVEDPVKALNERLRSTIIHREGRTYIDAELDGKHVSRVYDYTEGAWGSRVGFGSIVYYQVAGDHLRATLAGQASMSEFPVQVLADYGPDLKLAHITLSYNGAVQPPLTEEDVRSLLQGKLPQGEWTLSKDGNQYLVQYPDPPDGNGQGMSLRVNPLTGTVHDRTSGAPQFSLANREAPDLLLIRNGTEYLAELDKLLQNVLDAGGLKAAGSDLINGFVGDGYVLRKVTRDGRALTVKIDPFTGQWEEITDPFAGR
ncbi:M56 family metallopeptidase [Gorillibacterium sp. sgz500922]|uniref:M56 family metallopeptidase n=1 Tax=Gorillibacterium sp. sgz500922 TaxID=3446694 RepID=UPI003F669E1B